MQKARKLNFCELFASFGIDFHGAVGSRTLVQTKSTEAGQVSLEVFNVIGQKVKTVYLGHIVTELQSFDLNVLEFLRSTLIYRLNVNGNKITGKLLNARD